MASIKSDKDSHICITVIALIIMRALLFMRIKLA